LNPQLNYLSAIFFLFFLQKNFFNLKLCMMVDAYILYSFIFFE